MDWYLQLTQFLTFFSKPINNLYFSGQIPIIAALLLGIMGSLAPCQLSANIGAMSYTANRMSKGSTWFKEIVSFFVGKTLVYFLLAAIFILVGRGLEEMAIPFFQIIRKVMGPLLLIIGLYFIGWIKIRVIFTEKLLKYKYLTDRLSNTSRAFFLGVILTLAFCPTMFLLFFGLLMPIVVTTAGYGIALPLIFSLGTFLPVLLLLGLSYGIGIDHTFIKRSRKLGRIVQIASGLVLVFIGLNDIILYWGLI